MSTIGADDLDAICGLVHDLCGIYLDESKDYLIENRLADLVKRHGCESYVELARKARTGNRAVKSDVIDAITTNETLWFRDDSPFEAIRYRIVPDLIDARANSLYPRRLRIWSAACSTGQEAYSIGMALADVLPDLEQWDIKIVGTDVSEWAVARAVKGHYSEMEVGRGLDQPYLSGYFIRDGDGWRVCDAIRRLCRFEVRNLFDSFAGLGQFDIIFCRNVAIYFTQKDRHDLFRRLAKSLTPDGWILVGSSESLTDMGPEWSPHQYCRAMCYRPNLTAVAAT